MDAESTEDAIIYQGSRNEAEMIEINPGTGRYECRVRNDLGTTTKFIVLHPSGKLQTQLTLFIFRKEKIKPYIKFFFHLNK